MTDKKHKKKIPTRPEDVKRIVGNYIKSNPSISYLIMKSKMSEKNLEK